MITPDYVRAMAAYNAEMNRRLYEAAAALSDPERRAPRGAFFGSIHGTLNHLLWADRMWMSRFAGWARPSVTLAESCRLIDAWDRLCAARTDMDGALTAWAGTLDPAWLHGQLTWLSGALGREMTRPVALLVVHLFNHQTHHRGQVHAMLTAAGQATGDTDLMAIVLADRAVAVMTPCPP